MFFPSHIELGKALLLTAAAPVVAALLAAMPARRVYRDEHHWTAQQMAFLRVKSFEAEYAHWLAEHDGECPRSLEELLPYGGYVNMPRVTDPWGRRFVMKCGDAPTESRFGVVSLGPDGMEGNDDDLHSWGTRPRPAR